MFEFQYAGDSYHGCSSRGPKENRLNIFNWSLKHCWMLRMIWLNQQIHRRWKTFPEDHSSSYDWIIRLWLYVFWDGFYTIKMSFSSNWMNPQFLLTVCCCSVTKWLDSDIVEALRTCKMHFWDPSQWDQMCFEYHRVIFDWKKWVKIFTFAYGQGLGGW